MHKFKWGPGVLIHFAPDTGANGQEPNTETPNPDKTPGATPPANGEGAQPTGAAGKVDELPEWAQALVKELRAENAGHRKAKTDTEKAAEKAAQDQLKEQAQWQKLAEQHESRVAELEPLFKTQAERLTQFEEMIAKQLETEIKDWPKELKELDPGKEADLLARMAWVEKSRALAQKLAAVPPAPGNGRLPRPAGQAGSEAADQAARKQQESWARRQF